MEPLSINEITRAVNGVVSGNGSTPEQVDGISTDTRNLERNDLFIALKGERFDGNDFLDKAVAAGAAALMTARGAKAPRQKAGVAIISVADTGKAFLDLARYYRKKFSPQLVGITGSNGKTTTKDLLGCALSHMGETVASERSFNNFVGVPLTLFRITGDTRYVVLEIGTNQPGEIAALTTTAEPAVGLVTNVSHSHLEGLKTLEGIASEKAGLLREMGEDGLCMLNKDDPSFDGLAAAARGTVKTIGIRSRADYLAVDIEIHAEHSEFTIQGTRIRLPLMGFHNIYNALAAFACAVEMGAAPGRVAEAFRDFEGPPMRLKPVKAGGLFILNDTYNANPASVVSALKTFSVLPVEGRRIVVLGDMMELGEQTGKLHRQTGRELSCGAFDLIAAVGERADDYLEGASQVGIEPERLLRFRDTGEAVAAIPRLVSQGDAILVKGSRGMELEKLVDRFVAARNGQSGRAPGGQASRPERSAGSSEEP